MDGERRLQRRQGVAGAEESAFQAGARASKLSIWKTVASPGIPRVLPTSAPVAQQPPAVARQQREGRRAGPAIVLPALDPVPRPGRNPRAVFPSRSPGSGRSATTARSANSSACQVRVAAVVVAKDDAQAAVERLDIPPQLEDVLTHVERRSWPSTPARRRPASKARHSRRRASWRCRASPEASNGTGSRQVFVAKSPNSEMCVHSGRA